MPTSRFLRAASRTRTVTGTTSVGGTTSTIVSIMPDGTIKFVDRNGHTHTVQSNVNYTTANKNVLEPNTKAFRADPSIALFALVDALIARA